MGCAAGGGGTRGREEEGERDFRSVDAALIPVRLEEPPAAIARPPPSTHHRSACSSQRDRHPAAVHVLGLLFLGPRCAELPSRGVAGLGVQHAARRECAGESRADRSTSTGVSGVLATHHRLPVPLPTDLGRLALGKASSLLEIDWIKRSSAATPDFRFYYLGFYLHTCHRMRYKVGRDMLLTVAAWSLYG